MKRFGPVEVVGYSVIFGHVIVGAMVLGFAAYIRATTGIADNELDMLVAQTFPPPTLEIAILGLTLAALLFFAMLRFRRP